MECDVETSHDELVTELANAKLALVTERAKNQELETQLKSAAHSTASQSSYPKKRILDQSMNSSSIRNITSRFFNKSADRRARADRTKEDSASAGSDQMQASTKTHPWRRRMSVLSTTERMLIKNVQSLRKMLACGSSMEVSPLFNHAILANIFSCLSINEISRCCTVCTCWRYLPLREDCLLWSCISSSAALSERSRRFVWLLIAMSGRVAGAPLSDAIQCSNISHIGRSSDNNTHQPAGDRICYLDAQPCVKYNVQLQHGGLISRYTRIRWRRLPSFEELSVPRAFTPSRNQARPSKRTIYEYCLISAQACARTWQLKSEIVASERELESLRKEEKEVLQQLVAEADSSCAARTTAPRRDCKVQSACQPSIQSPPGYDMAGGPPIVSFSSSSVVIGGGVRTSTSRDDSVSDESGPKSHDDSDGDMMILAAKAAVAMGSANSKPSNCISRERNALKDHVSSNRSGSSNSGSKLRKAVRAMATRIRVSSSQDWELQSASTESPDCRRSSIITSMDNGSASCDFQSSSASSLTVSAGAAPNESNRHATAVGRTGEPRGRTLSAEAAKRWGALQQQLQELEEHINLQNDRLQSIQSFAEGTMHEIASLVLAMYDEQHNQGLGVKDMLATARWLFGPYNIIVPLSRWLFEFVDSVVYSRMKDSNMASLEPKEAQKRLHFVVQDFVQSRPSPHNQIDTDVERTFGDIVRAAQREMEQDFGTMRTRQAEASTSTLQAGVCSPTCSTDSSPASFAKLSEIISPSQPLIVTTSSTPDDDSDGPPVTSGLAPTIIRLRRSLKNVLLAYSTWDPVTCYCQGMNYVAAMLLRVFDGDEASSFCMLCALMHSRSYRLHSMYTNELIGVEQMFAIHERLLSIHIPHLKDHFSRHDISADMYGASRWFMTQFSSLALFPISTATHVWDWWIVDGWPVIHALAIAVLSNAASDILAGDFTTSVHFLSTRLPSCILMLAKHDENHGTQHNKERNEEPDSTFAQRFSSLPSPIAASEALAETPQIWHTATRRLFTQARALNVTYNFVHSILHKLCAEWDCEEFGVFPSIGDHERSESSRRKVSIFRPKSWRS